jgi:hypothetical protein
MSRDLRSEIRDAFAQRDFLMTRHAVRRAEQRRISLREIEQAMTSDSLELLEDYPESSRGPCCLMLGITGRGRILHVQVTYPPRVWVITLYEPGEEKWVNPRTRR